MLLENLKNATIGTQAVKSADEHVLPTCKPDTTPRSTDSYKQSVVPLQSLNSASMTGKGTSTYTFYRVEAQRDE